MPESHSQPRRNSLRRLKSYREVMFIIKTNKSALTAGNKINGYSSKAALAKDMLVILLGKKS